MQATKIRLRFKAPLHIAAHGVGFEHVSWVLHSDTLYSAIITVWSYLSACEAKEIAEAESPPFLLSSAFPYQSKWEFYPKPCVPWHHWVTVEAHHSIERKQFSRVQFIEAKILQQLLRRQQPRFDPTCTRQGGRFWTHVPESPPETANDAHKRNNAARPNQAKLKIAPTPPIILETEVPRVMIDRVTSKSMNYFVSELRFAEGAGLFFWVKFRNSAIRERFIQVLRVLGDEGLGLDRTSGKGLFEVRKEDIQHDATLPGLENAPRFMTLSLYYPKSTEMTSDFLKGSAYELVKRGGYVFGRSYRRQILTMFAEGSVFSGQPNAEQIYGSKKTVLDASLANKALRHQVFRYGYAFPIGFYDEEQT